MGIDIGLARCGVGVIRDGQYAISHLIQTPNTESFADRAYTIWGQISELVSTQRPTHAIMETFWGSQRTPSMKALIKLEGLIEVSWYMQYRRKLGGAETRWPELQQRAAATIKKNVAGSGRADKETVREAVTAKLGANLPAGISVDEIDALAAAITLHNELNLE